MIYPYSNFPLGKKEGVPKGLLFKSVSVSSYLHYIIQRARDTESAWKMQEETTSYLSQLPNLGKR